MARDHKLSFVIPRRKSSIQALRPEPPSHSSLEDPAPAPSHNNSNNAKAHKILGSSDADVRQHEFNKARTNKRVSGRSGLMRISESRPVEDHHHHQQQQHPPTTASTASLGSNAVPNNDNPLRQRASSPLLGNSYRNRQGSLSSLPPPPKPHQQKQQLPARSSSKLHSFYDVQEPSKSASKSHGSRSTKRVGPTDLSDVPELAGDETVKEKHRPPRIDLSMLFPKPRPQAVPLLSPHRMTNSPSPVSVNSDASPTKTQSLGTRLTKAARPRDSLRMMRQKHTEQNEAQMYSRNDKQKPREWFDGPEGDVSDEEVTYSRRAPVTGVGYQQTRNWGDDANDTQPQPPAAQPTSPPTTIEVESIGIPSITKAGKKTPDSMATPTPASSITVKLQNSLQAWEHGSNNSSRSRVSSVSKKTSNSALHNSNLNESSILCLTSSDEEDEGETEPEPEQPPRRKHSIGARSDVTDAEAAFGACTISGLPPHVKMSRSRESMIAEARQPPERPFSRTKNTPPPSSSYRPRASSNRTRPRVSGVPMISEPPEDELPPLPSNPTLDIRSPEYLGRNRAPSSNRRSRVIAVTRHEESLLEIMRQKAGPPPTSTSNNNFSDAASESTFEDPKKAQPDRPHRSHHRPNRSVNSGAFTDTSFLRLSTCSPSQTVSANNIVPDLGTTFMGSTTFMDSDGSASYGASDTDQRTDNSNASPRISLIHSDNTLPSPSTTSLASPLTPTLPMHKFSPQPPPAEPSPSSQSSGNMENKRHSRTRTDSSAAIVLDAPDDASSKQQRGRLGSVDLPVWAVGWKDDAAGLGVVH